MTRLVTEEFGEFFLTWPDLFPARPAGEGWGERRVLLDIAGGPYAVEGLSPRQDAEIRKRFEPLALEGVAPEAAPRIRCFRAPDSDFRSIDVAGWNHRIDLDYEPRAVRVAGWELFGRVDWDPRFAGALWTPAEGGGTFLGSFENFLRVVVAYRALDCGGAVFHSAGIEAEGKAFLFFGHSGAGKSTLSRLSQEIGHQVLSDELNILLLEDDHAVLERMPFAGDFGQVARPRRRYPLGGIFGLRQGAPASRTRVPRPRGVAELAASAPFVNGDPYRSPRLLENLELLTKSVDIETLTFGLDPSFWSILTPSR